MDVLYDLNIVSILFRLFLTLLCGGILGVERGRKNRPAGFRTYMVVSVASTMVMITDQYISQLYPTADPSKMVAQVISGIGFLGAGTIILSNRNRVRGLTTAAGLWATACIGLAIGVGYYLVALISWIMIFISMSSLYWIDNMVKYFRTEITIYVELSDMRKLSVFLGYIRDNKMKVIDFEIIKSNDVNDSIVSGIFTLKLLNKIKCADAMDILSKYEGICSIQEI